MKRDQLIDAVKKVESEGLLPPGQSDRVGSRLAELLFPPKDHARSAAAVIAWLGGILVAAGILFFVAANWDELGKVPKLVLIFGTLTGLHAVGFRLAIAPGHRPALGLALIGAAMLCFGGGIALVAQIYNLSSKYPNAILVWWLLCVPFVVITESRKLLLIPLVLFLVWVHWHAGVWNEEHLRGGSWLWSDSEIFAFGFLELGLAAFLAAAAALARGTRCDRFSGPLAIFGRLAAFAGLFILAFEGLWPDMPVAGEPLRLWSRENAGRVAMLLAPGGLLSAAGLALGLVAAATRALEKRRVELSDAAAALASSVVLALALLAVPPGGFLVANLLVLGGVIALVVRGIRMERAADVNLGVIFFLATVMARYFEFVGQRSEPFFAFLGAGVLLLALGAFLERKRRGWVARAAGSTP